MVIAPLYPHTGDEREGGVNKNIINVPLSHKQGSQHFREVRSDLMQTTKGVTTWRH